MPGSYGNVKKVKTDAMCPPSALRPVNVFYGNCRAKFRRKLMNLSETTARMIRIMRMKKLRAAHPSRVLATVPHLRGSTYMQGFWLTERVASRSMDNWCLRKPLAF